MIHNYTSDNMLRTVFMQCSAVELMYHLFDVYVGCRLGCIFFFVLLYANKHVHNKCYCVISQGSTELLVSTVMCLHLGPM